MLNPAQLLQAFFLLAASTIVFLSCIPIIREQFITYGPRAAAPVKTYQNATKEPQSPQTTLQYSIEAIASLQVPHAYFHHFYIVSVASSLFWAIQFFTNGKLLQRLTAAALESAPSTTMSLEQIQLTWALMSIQGLRRQFESNMFAKPSTSKMWIVHYLLGIIFYLAVGIAVWIEGAETLSHHHHQQQPPSLLFTTPSLRTLLTLSLFLLASSIQHVTHAHLASLPTYTLPQHPLFKVLICPHYTAECLIYLSLALIAAPAPTPAGVSGTGAGVNTTLFTAFVFVAANLSVTAVGTRRWYEGKFGREAVRGRWVMLPFVW